MTFCHGGIAMLGGIPAMVVTARLDRPGSADGIPVLPAAGFLAAIP
ncbi:MAG: hypothetical protein HY924_15810 [Elusimicrobia bacterium]|nr:hypothetical protein [Elusimicrobiota bacterium]